MARPPHKPTAPKRRQVAIAAAAGWSHAEIAQALGISRTTLLRHYRAELREAAAMKRMDVLIAMHKAAVGGNVAAMKAYLAAGATDSAPAPAPRGKKEQASLDAQNAASGTDWEDLLPGGIDGPKLH